VIDNRDIVFYAELRARLPTWRRVFSSVKQHPTATEPRCTARVVASRARAVAARAHFSWSAIRSGKHNIYLRRNDHAQ